MRACFGPARSPPPSLTAVVFAPCVSASICNTRNRAESSWRTFKLTHCEYYVYLHCVQHCACVQEMVRESEVAKFIYYSDFQADYETLLNANEDLGSPELTVTELCLALHEKMTRKTPSFIEKPRLSEKLVADCARQICPAIYDIIFGDSVNKFTKAVLSVQRSLYSAGYLLGREHYLCETVQRRLKHGNIFIFAQQLKAAQRLEPAPQVSPMIPFPESEPAAKLVAELRQQLKEAETEIARLRIQTDRMRQVVNNLVAGSETRTVNLSDADDHDHCADSQQSIGDSPNPYAGHEEATAALFILEEEESDTDLELELGIKPLNELLSACIVGTGTH